MMPAERSKSARTQKATAKKTMKILRAIQKEGVAEKEQMAHASAHTHNPAFIAATLIRGCKLIWMMAEYNLAARYAGTAGGIVWNIIQPLTSIAVFWLVFSLGFRATGPLGMPFVLYFVSGLVPWLFYSEALNTGTTSVTANAHLIRKTTFAAEMLPLISLASALMNHAIFLVIAIAAICAHGIGLSTKIIFIPYYMLCAAALTIGLAWLLSSLNVFFRDIGEVLGTLMNFWFWLTPVVWTADMVPEPWRWLLAVNPAHYIVEGYRRCLIYDTGALPSGWETAVFWTTTLLLLAAGLATFRHLKKDFVDVL